VNCICEKCGFCKIKHKKVEAGGLWYCPNALCNGPGGQWFRRTLSSYEEDEYESTHIVDEKEWKIKGQKYNEKTRIRP